jgi:hypothetical protein
MPTINITVSSAVSSRIDSALPEGTAKDYLIECLKRLVRDHEEDQAVEAALANPPAEIDVT